MRCAIHLARISTRETVPDRPEGGEDNVVDDVGVEDVALDGEEGGSAVDED